MKKYRIDNQLLYDPEDRSLVRIGDDLSRIVLTNISDRLFCLLLASDGTVIPRDTILQKVWDEHSLTASGNNLNNYISGLRKQLAVLGLENPLIITEPKVGFRINAEMVSVETCPEEPLRENFHREAASAIAALPPAKAVREDTVRINNTRRKIWPGVFIALSVFALFLLIFFMFFSAPASRQAVSGVRYVFSAGGCQFYTPDGGYAQGHRENAQRLISSLSKKYVSSCMTDDIVIYDLFGVFDADRYRGKVMIAQCKVKNHSVLSCKSHFLYAVNHNEK